MLNSDPKRQAVHSLRGYAYQIWQSLNEWLSLSEGEALFIEGAEDIDKLGLGRAKTTQVKDIQSGSVTLNSDEVIDAIKHYWEHKNLNPKVKIIYRFLTTAERGKEKSAPFGKKKGLDFWDDCKHEHIDPTPLKNYLLTKEDLPIELKEFIRTADDETLRTELILPIEWDTGNPVREYLEGIILYKIKTLGIHFKILPAVSEKALPALLKYVFEKACSATDRELTYIKLLEQFEGSVTVPVPISAMTEKISALTAQFEGMMQFPSTGATPQLALIQQSITPALPEKYARRQKLVDSLKEIFLKNKFITLHGSTGMGKSSIAALLVNSLKLEHKWVALRGVDANSINAVLFGISVTLRNFEDTILIIDDISFGIDLNIYENALAGLISLVLSKNGYVIITTQDDLPDKVSHYLPSANDLIVDVPAMDQDEVKELAQRHGCPANKVLDLWSSFVFIKTGGHPQLVHAKIRSLESSGWPAPTVESLVNPDNFETIKREVKKRLISDFPMESARTLSYRLSIMHHPFKKQHALVMSDKSPAIDKPGEAFDLLVGPWVERLSSGYFRISPLLKDLANEIWPITEIKNLHAQAVKALLSEKTLSPNEVSNAFLHGILWESGEVLMPLIYYLLTNKKDILPRISEDLSWLTAIAIAPGQKIYSKNPVVSLSLRHIQFRVAAEIDKNDSALKIDEAWEQEIKDLKADEFKDGTRLLFLFETILRIEVPFPLSIMMSRIKEAFQLLSDKTKPYGQSIEKTLTGKESIRFITLLAIARCKDYEDLLTFMATLEHGDEDIKNLYLSFLNTKTDWAGFLIGNVYLNEYNSASPEWLECLEAFKKTISLALTWRAMSLVANAYHMMAVIYDEHLEDSEKAIEILDEVRSHLGDDNPIIEDARAMIYFRQKKYKETLEILDRILPIWKTEFDTMPLIAYRRAEISAAMTGNWGKAASLAQAGAKYAAQSNNKKLELGLRADQAFALWKTDEKQQSIELFAAIIKDFHLLPDPLRDIQSYALQKLVGHTLTWLLNDVKQEHIETHAEPQPGCFSNNEIDERIKNYPLQPIDFFWMILAEIETELKVDEKIFKYFKEQFYTTSYPVIRTSLAKLTIIHALRKQDPQSLIREFYAFVAAIESTKRLVSEANNIFKKGDTDGVVHLSDDFYESLIILLCFALFHRLSQNRDMTELVSIWKVDAGELNLTDSRLLTWFDFLKNVASMNNNELTGILSDGSAGIGKRFVSAILLSNADNITPEITYYSHLLLFHLAEAKQYVWGKEIQNLLEQVVISSWTKIAREKSFSLLSPRLNMPAILGTCQLASCGFEKIANILYAARNAVKLEIPVTMMTSMKKYIK
ncbi:MAG: ATP-binding protein [Thermodesulfovibrionales bacterium]